MKPTITPAQAARIERLIDDLDALYLDLCQHNDLAGFQMGKISTARGELAFVLSSTYRTQPVQLVVLEGATR